MIPLYGRWQRNSQQPESRLECKDKLFYIFGYHAKYHPGSSIVSDHWHVFLTDRVSPGTEPSKELCPSRDTVARPGPRQRRGKYKSSYTLIKPHTTTSGVSHRDSGVRKMLAFTFQFRIRRGRGFKFKLVTR